MKRWLLTIAYRTDAGPHVVQHELQELSEQDRIVEDGPHWDTIIYIHTVRINHTDGANLTVEQAGQIRGSTRIKGAR